MLEPGQESPGSTLQLGMFDHLYIQNFLQLRLDGTKREHLVSHSTASWADIETEKRFYWTKKSHENPVVQSVYKYP